MIQIIVDVKSTILRFPNRSFHYIRSQRSVSYYYFIIFFMFTLFEFFCYSLTRTYRNIMKICKKLLN